VSYHWVEHTAELELRIDARSEEAVFEDALRALGEVMAGDDRGTPAFEDVEVTAADRAALLAGFMDELVFLAETADFVPERAARLELSPGRVRAAVEGRRGAARHLVKGVTYHRLAFSPGEDGYEATVVLDV
jgi:SHS2 domain-containing protein